MKRTVAVVAAAAALLTPALAAAQSKLLLTEVVMNPTPAEYIEIHNPGAVEVDLTNYYLADYATYYAVVTSTAPVNTDFVVRFPAGAKIPPRAHQTVSIGGATCFKTAPPTCANLGPF